MINCVRRFWAEEISDGYSEHNINDFMETQDFDNYARLCIWALTDPDKGWAIARLRIGIDKKNKKITLSPIFFKYMWE